MGFDAVSGKKVIARMGRYGPMVQIGDSANEEEKEDFNILFDMNKAQQNIYEMEDKLNEILK